MTIKKFSIIGERCSGTRYLQRMMLTNFDIVDNKKNVIHKHFFQHPKKYKKKNVDDVLFIGIVREPYAWMNSFIKRGNHLEDDMYFKGGKFKVDNFLNKPFISKYPKNKNGREIKGGAIDINPDTGKHYKNIFELRKHKLKFQMKVLPTLVKNYILIRYEDFRDNWEVILPILKNKYGLKTRTVYPKNYTEWTKRKLSGKKNVKFPIKKKLVYNNKSLDKSIERKMGYCIGEDNEISKFSVDNIIYSSVV